MLGAFLQVATAWPGDSCSSRPSSSDFRAYLDLVLVKLASQQLVGISVGLALLRVCIFDQGWQRTAAWACQLEKLGYAQSAQITNYKCSER